LRGLPRSPRSAGAAARPRSGTASQHIAARSYFGDPRSATVLRELNPVHVESKTTAHVERSYLHDSTSPSESSGSPYDAKRLVRDRRVPAARANPATREAGGDLHASFRGGHHGDDPNVLSYDSALRPSKLSRRVTQSPTIRVQVLSLAFVTALALVASPALELTGSLGRVTRRPSHGSAFDSRPAISPKPS
jgi:hypothetical protein